jgi:NRAMP (natural resistance-associated macrophage protein)-like metal ion transporter
MSAVQLMCARLGMVTGVGLAGAIRRRYSRGVLWFACSLLIVANTINIAADLGGMAAAMELVTSIPHSIWLPTFAATIVALIVWSRYKHIARVFKWLTLVLFGYVVTAFLVKPNWSAVLRATFVPQIEFRATYLATFLGVMGTTISPYLFFWQAAQEVEEEREKGRRTIHQRQGATDEELRSAQIDVITGMFFAGIVMYFIVLTTGATLHASGNREIETARDAAEALRPLAGDAAYLIFSIGLIGTGMLGVPVLAGSAAYAVAEAMHWRASLDAKPRTARRFYGVFAASVVIGLLLDYFKFNAVRMLFVAAVVNGVLAPPLIVLLIFLTSDRKVMGDRVSSRLLRWLGWATAAVMAAASVGMLVL